MRVPVQDIVIYLFIYQGRLPRKFCSSAKRIQMTSSMTLKVIVHGDKYNIEEDGGDVYIRVQQLQRHL